MSYIPGKDVSTELLDFLNLPKGTRSFDVHASVDGLVTVKCEYLLNIETEDIFKFYKYFSKYVEKKKEEKLKELAKKAFSGEGKEKTEALNELLKLNNLV